MVTIYSRTNLYAFFISTISPFRYSHARINAYRALASPSLICLSSSDPFLTAFVLSDDLKKLSTMEKEFVQDYLVSETDNNHTLHEMKMP